jgi:chromatin structure-remodeling complex subunit RSC9
MAAKDFITNVSATFTGAQAQVIPFGTTQKYTIRGIRPRSVPVDPTTRRPYLRCQWYLPPSQTAGQQSNAQSHAECNEYTSQPKQMWDHILATHLQLQKDEFGKWKLESKPDINKINGAPVQKRYNCHWGGCKHFASTNGSPSAYTVGMHIKTHLPDTSAKASVRNKHNLNSITSNGSQAQAGQQTVKWHSTATDERNDAAGLPLASVLVLRNLARQMAKIDYSGQLSDFPNGSLDQSREDEDEEDRNGGWVRKVFAPVKDQLFYVMAHNWSLREYMPSLCSAIANGGG